MNSSKVCSWTDLLPCFCCHGYLTDLTVSSRIFAGYSGSHAAVVGSVVVTNLATGKRCGGWDSAEVGENKFPSSYAYVLPPFRTSPYPTWLKSSFTCQPSCIVFIDTFY